MSLSLLKRFSLLKFLLSVVPVGLTLGLRLFFDGLMGVLIDVWLVVRFSVELCTTSLKLRSVGLNLKIVGFRLMENYYVYKELISAVSKDI